MSWVPLGADKSVVPARWWDDLPAPVEEHSRRGGQVLVCFGWSRLGVSLPDLACGAPRSAREPPIAYVRKICDDGGPWHQDHGSEHDVEGERHPLLRRLRRTANVSCIRRENGSVSTVPDMIWSFGGRRCSGLVICAPGLCSWVALAAETRRTRLGIASSGGKSDFGAGVGGRTGSERSRSRARQG